ncbi:MarR family winged helix-turn-helix transcriptional regulator [Paenibacillus alvei]|uniref:MarR family transcriptional regulator n=1 Tax=Paenibacillus alvei TaxID=44250 RepID=A0AAP7DJT7_PAEAL|nr:MarR family transcriptional regulator [Paenibacillus alvei]NOJ73148.1 MarR family transcriptional regulator [Paenibacillus alvei]
MMLHLERRVGYMLGQTHRRLCAELGARFRPYDMTNEQWGVLIRLIEEEGITQKKLAERCGKDQPTLTRIIQLLMRKGWVERAICKQDRRAYRLAATPAGRSVVEQLVPIEQECIAQVMAGFTSEEEQRLLESLHRIQNNVAMAEKERLTASSNESGEDR